MHFVVLSSTLFIHAYYEYALRFDRLLCRFYVSIDSFAFESHTTPSTTHQLAPHCIHTLHHPSIAYNTVHHSLCIILYPSYYFTVRFNVMIGLPIRCLLQCFTTIIYYSIIRLLCNISQQQNENHPCSYSRYGRYHGANIGCHELWRYRWS